MRNAPEVVREVGVHGVRMTTEQQLLHLYGVVRLPNLPVPHRLLRLS